MLCWFMYSVVKIKVFFASLFTAWSEFWTLFSTLTLSFDVSQSHEFVFFRFWKRVQNIHVLAVWSSCFRLNATSVLDFVWACRHIPKIWQGRELKTVQVKSTDPIQQWLIKQANKQRNKQTEKVSLIFCSACVFVVSTPCLKPTELCVPVFVGKVVFGTVSPLLHTLFYIQVQYYVDGCPLVDGCLWGFQ